MRIWIVGSKGMLGSEVIQIAKELGHEIYDSSTEIDCILNCAGKRPGSSSLEMIESNTVLPHWLAKFGIPMVHMSTDCVYSGRTWEYFRRGSPNPNDLYGRTKLAGEVDASHVLNVRGSFIGFRHGFLAWILSAHGKIEVWKNAFWNGVTVKQMARTLVTLAEQWPQKMGENQQRVIQVGCKNYMSKARMAKYLVEKLDLPVSLELVDTPLIYRVLEPDIEFPSVESVLDEIIEEYRNAPHD